MRSQPTGIVRLAFRLPVYLYRANLGWLLGHRFLLLTHRGRQSGRTRHTVLEVLRYDPTTRESVVVSAWGEHSDWYRNLRAVPAVEVRTGRERYTPAQRFLRSEEIYATAADYEGSHPLSSRLISRMLGYPLDGTEVARRNFVSRVRMVAFSPIRASFGRE